jgi:hypothetical protein
MIVPDGEWVAWQDYDRLRAALEHAQAVASGYLQGRTELLAERAKLFATVKKIASMPANSSEPWDMRAIAREALAGEGEKSTRSTSGT